MSVRTKPRRCTWSRGVCVIGIMLLPCLGCVAHKDVQYFAVMDPEGNQNYFRVTVDCSSLGTDYKMQSGHFSAAAVDVIRGDMPEIPTLDLPLEHERILDEAVSLYHQRLLRQGYAMVPYQRDRALWIAVAQQIDQTRRVISDASGILDRATELKARVDRARSATDTLEALAETLSQRQAALAELRTEVRRLRRALNEATEQEQRERIRSALAEKEQQEQQLEAAVAEAKSKVLDAAEAAGIEAISVEGALREARGRLRRATEAFEQISAQVPAAKRRMAKELSYITQLQADLANITGTTPPGRIEDPSTALALTEAEAQPPTWATATQPALPFGTEGHTIDNELKELARLIWFASLSTQDLIAMGQLQTTDAYQFRKHVIWISATQFNLEKIGGQIDSIINSVIGLASVAKEQAAKRSAQRKAKKKWLAGVLKRAAPVLGPEAAALADILFPEGGAEAAQPTNALQQLKELRDSVIIRRGDQ